MMEELSEPKENLVRINPAPEPQNHSVRGELRDWCWGRLFSNHQSTEALCEGGWGKSLNEPEVSLVRINPVPARGGLRDDGR